MLYLVILAVACTVGWFILKPTVAYLALRRDPISAGQTYIKRLICKDPSIKVGVISDEAYRHLAHQAFEIAELSHTVECQSLFRCYIDYLDLYIEQIRIIMSGRGTDLESPVANILSKYGVQAPKINAGTQI